MMKFGNVKSFFCKALVVSMVMTAAAPLCSLTDELASAEENLLTDGSFEKLEVGYELPNKSGEKLYTTNAASAVITDDNASDGEKSVKLVSADGKAAVLNYVIEFEGKVEVGKTYVVSADIHADGDIDGAAFPDNRGKLIRKHTRHIFDETAAGDM